MKYCFVAEKYKDAVAALGLERPEDWMRYSVQNIISDRTTETSRIIPPAPLPPSFAKIYRYPCWDDRFRILFRGGLLGRSRAKIEFDNLRRLNARGLSPQVVAYGQERKIGTQRVSLLVIEEVPDAVSLDKFIVGPLRPLPADARREFIDTLAAFTKEMNDGGFVNGEYHWRNILVQKMESSFRFQVIDPSGSRRRYRMLYPFFDLATLDVCGPYFFTRTERLRFFKRYAESSNARLSPQQKSRLGKILRLRDKIARKELKRYRKIIPDNPASK